MRSAALIGALLISVWVAAQDVVNYYFVEDVRDTVLCSYMNQVTDRKGNLVRLSSIPWGQRDSVALSAIEMEHVTTFFRFGEVHEKIPNQPNSSEDHMTFAQRYANGRLKLYYRATYSNEAHSYVTFYDFYLRTPDGQYHDLFKPMAMTKYKRQHIHQELMPILLSCGAYKQKYGDDMDGPLKIYNGVMGVPDNEKLVSVVVERVHFFNAECP